MPITLNAGRVRAVSNDGGPVPASPAGPTAETDAARSFAAMLRQSQTQRPAAPPSVGAPARAPNPPPAPSAAPAPAGRPTQPGAEASAAATAPAADPAPPASGTGAPGDGTDGAPADAGAAPAASQALDRTLADRKLRAAGDAAALRRGTAATAAAGDAASAVAAPDGQTDKPARGHGVRAAADATAATWPSPTLPARTEAPGTADGPDPTGTTTDLQGLAGAGQAAHAAHVAELKAARADDPSALQGAAGASAALPAPADALARPAVASSEARRLDVGSASPDVSSLAAAAALRATNAGPAAPVAVAIATPVHAADFAQALGLQISVLARDGVQQAELHLHPADLGPVSVKIAMEGTQARVDFGADVAATRHAIEAGIPELASALRDAGFTLAGGGVSQHAAGQQQPGGAPAQASASRASRVASAQAVERVQAAAQRIRTGAGVDLFA